MALETTLYTSHRITTEGSTFNMQLMLDDEGKGMASVFNGEDPVMSFNADRLGELCTLLTEASDIVRMMQTDGSTILHALD